MDPVKPPVALPSATSKGVSDTLVGSRALPRGRKIAVLEMNMPSDLDYQLLRLNRKHIEPNRIMIPGNEKSSIKYLYPQQIANTVTECNVLAATGTTGTVTGIMISNSYYIKMEYSSSYQELWPVKLERGTSMFFRNLNWPALLTS